VPTSKSLVPFVGAALLLLADSWWGLPWLAAGGGLLAKAALAFRPALRDPAVPRDIAVAVPARPDRFMRLMADYVRRAAEALGLPEPATLPVGGETATLATVREQPGRVTAVAALTDGLALAVLAAIADAGASCPGDLAVIG